MNWKQKIALILFGICLSIVFLELMLRLLGFFSLAIHEYKQSHRLQSNEKIKVLCLGESTTYRAYTRYLEKELNKDDVLGEKFEVIDKGIPGTNTAVILSKFEEYLADYKPDLVVTMMGINDTSSTVAYRDNFKVKTKLFLEDFRVWKLYQLLFEHFKATFGGSFAFAADMVLDAKKLEDMKALLEQGRYQEILAQTSFFESVTSSNQSYINEFYRIGGEVYFQSGKYDEAVQIYDKAIQVNSSAEEVLLFNIGVCYRKQQKFEQAITHYEKYLEKIPHLRSEIYSSIGSSYREKDDFENAKFYFQKAIEENSENAFPYSELAEVYRLKKQYVDAVPYYRKMIQLDPNYEWAYIEFAATLRLIQKYDEAVSVLEQGITVNPQNDKFYGGLALAYLDKGDSKKAKEYFKRAESVRMALFPETTKYNYNELVDIALDQNITVLCMQYPLREISSLKKLIEHDNVVFVSNETIFKEAIREKGYDYYFSDSFAGDFGHCTDEGDLLIAKNLAKHIWGLFK